MRTAISCVLGDFLRFLVYRPLLHCIASATFILNSSMQSFTMCYMIGATGIVRVREVRQVRRRLRGFNFERLRARRVELGLSGAEVARTIGVAASTYSQWERGLAHPRVDALARCARELGSPLSDFVAVPPNEEYLGDLRISRGMTQAELAGKIGVSPQYLGSLERAQTKLNAAITERLAAAVENPPDRVAAAYERARVRPRGEPA